MVKLNSKYPIGIQICDQDIYAVQLKKTQKRLAVLALMRREIKPTAEESPGENASVIAALRAISESGRFSGKRAVFLVPYQNTVSFPVHFQADSREAIEAAILREAQKNISYPVDEAIIDYPSLHSVRSTAKSTTYSATIIAIRKDIVLDYLALIKQAGFMPEAIDFSVNALIRLHQYLQGPIDNLISLCNIGTTKSILSVVDRDRVLARRHISWGIQTIYQKVLSNMEFIDSQDKVKFLLKNCGLVHDVRDPLLAAGQSSDEEVSSDRERIVYQIIAPYIDELLYEFHHLTGYVRSEHPDARLDHIDIYGEGGWIRDLDQYLEKRLDISTRLLNPLAEMPLIDDAILPDRTEGYPFAMALGLAMRKVPWL
ncbi:MAG: pilus assembly protein PilM [Desulfobacterales bacterium]|nr:pilus assembly protein PilM [Desulfobacterales bacterium]